MKCKKFGFQNLLTDVTKLFSRLFLYQLSLLLIVTMALAPMAIAQPIHGQEIVASIRSAEAKAQRDLDSVAGQGTSNQIEGAAQEALGKVQRGLSNTVNQSEGVSNQIEGRAKRDIGRTQEATENLGNRLQNAAEDAGDSIQDLFR